MNPTVHSSATADADYLLAELIAAEPWHFWFRFRRQIVLQAWKRHCPLARRVLEVGCGTGFVLEGMRQSDPELHIAGCDRLAEALGHVRERAAGVLVFQGDILRLPVRQRFDAILALDVIEHVDDDQGALDEIFSALTPGGTLIVTVPQHQWLWSAVDDFSHHRRRYSRTALLERVRAAGFDVLRCTSLFATTLPLMAAARLKGRHAFDPAAELRIPRVVSALTSLLLRPERVLFDVGVSLPFGGSLMVVASRPLSS